MVQGEILRCGIRTQLMSAMGQKQTTDLRLRSRGCPLCPGGFNRSAQHLLILRGEEVCHGDVADLVHGSSEGRAVGAMEEWAKCCGHLAGVGKEEQDRR